MLRTKQLVAHELYSDNSFRKHSPGYTYRAARLQTKFVVFNCSDYLHLREHLSMAFSALSSWTGIADCDLTEEHPQRLACAQTDSWFLPTFGISPLLGRNFRADEDRSKAPKVALLSYGL